MPDNKHRIFIEWSKSYSEMFNPFNFDIIDINSFHLWSAHERLKKNVGIPNYFTTQTFVGLMKFLI